MGFPLSVRAVGVQEVELRAMEHENSEVIVGVQVSDEMRRKPRRRAIRRKRDREVSR